MSYKKVVSCRVCGSEKLKSYLDLGRLPLANRLVSSPQEVDRFPLELLLCEECKLSQLSVIVDPEVLYSDYVYESSVSKTFTEHCRSLARNLKTEFGFKNTPPCITDIASNDGCLLRQFREEGYIVRGVEPCTRLAYKCMEDGIPVRNGFWTERLSRSSRSWSGEDVITATNVFAHVDDLRDFLRAVNYQLEYNKRGILVIEVPYFPRLIENCEFDTIYHEHLSYFHLKPIISILAVHGLHVFKAHHLNIHGGSIRIYASQYDYPTESTVNSVLSYEAKFLSDDSVYENFQKRAGIIKEMLYHTLVSLKESDKKVYAFGASAKGCTLLNYCGINNTILPKVIDETEAKIGKFIPGCNIPIEPFSAFDEKPDYILLTAWNFKEEMMAKTKHIGAKYIIPIPEIQIV